MGSSSRPRARRSLEHLREIARAAPRKPLFPAARSLRASRSRSRERSSTGRGRTAPVPEPPVAVPEGVLRGMACEEVVEDAHVEADRVLAARQLLARREENAMVILTRLGRSRDQPLVVGPVLGHDRTPFGGHQREQPLVVEPRQVAAVVDGEDVVAELAQADGDRSPCTARRGEASGEELLAGAPGRLGALGGGMLPFGDVVDLVAVERVVVDGALDARRRQPEVRGRLRDRVARVCGPSRSPARRRAGCRRAPPAGRAPPRGTRSPGARPSSRPRRCTARSARCAGRRAHARAVRARRTSPWRP